MKNAFGYYRVSTEEQAQEGKSIEAQKRICQKWAEENDYKIVAEFYDEGKSATNLNRSALKELLARIEEECVEALLVQDTDRLARNTLDHLTVKSILKKHGVKLISISQPMLDDSPEGHLIDTIIASVNAFQSQITGRKTSKVLVEKAKLGWYPGNPPIGYSNAENPNSTGTLDKRIIVPNPKIAPYITKAFKMYATGETSFYDLLNFLNSKGVKPERGTKVAMSTLGTILSNKFYTGQFTWGGVEYKGSHQPIISVEIFNKVQQTLVARNQHACRKRKHFFLLKGFVYSSTNHSRMVGEVHTKPNGKMFRFYCSLNDRKGTYVKAEELENQVGGIFEDLQISKDYRNLLLNKAKEVAQESQKQQTEEKRLLTREINKIDKAMEELEDSRFVSRTIDNDTFTRVYSRYEEQRADLMQQVSTVNKNYSKKVKILDRALELAENIGKAYQNADPDLKRIYLSLFIKKLYVEKGFITDIELTEDAEMLLHEGKFNLASFGVA